MSRLACSRKMPIVFFALPAMLRPMFLRSFERLGNKRNVPTETSQRRLPIRQLLVCLREIDRLDPSIPARRYQRHSAHLLFELSHRVLAWRIVQHERIGWVGEFV